MIVSEDCFVKIHDVINNETKIYRFVKTKRKTFFLQSHCEYNYGENVCSRAFDAIEVLEEGGNGIDTLSKESELGRRLYNMPTGETITYTNNSNEKEEFLIVGVSKDGTVWE